MRYDPDFPHHPPRRPVRRDANSDLLSVDALWRRHVDARRQHRDDPTRGGSR